ncbi:hypothetical protein HPB50_022037 [Hyalomma asiaticum]|uniref:Uncharacterized protein n=1 Tax=Hyalomma asiaticum TaxID=266040 RepID=A0ACB7T1E4_HYAAI|nr:hypothetical protein HPB50_022037 [Hyalomma asiaticum]
MSTPTTSVTTAWVHCGPSGDVALLVEANKEVPISAPKRTMRTHSPGEPKKAKEFGNREAGRWHDVDESCVRLWRKKKDSLQAAHRDRRSFRGPKTGAYPELEAQLVKFIEDTAYSAC